MHLDRGVKSSLSFRVTAAGRPVQRQTLGLGENNGVDSFLTKSQLKWSEALLFSCDQDVWRGLIAYVL